MKKSNLIALFSWLVLSLTNPVFAEMLNINKAGAEEIALKLGGIGLKKAKDIVKYRNSHGEFKSMDDLTKVSGIGAKTVEKIKNMITLKTGKSVKKR